MSFCLFPEGVSKRAVAYYRHSAEDKQELSVPIQREQAHKFAQEHRIEIIHEEADEGETGLNADRDGFDVLFRNWILNKHAPHFDYVLVFNVSRWGRFQDQDEAAYYEFRCKQQGKQVVYVTRGFPKEDQKLITHLQASIERYMAAEYSRQLSDNVFRGCIKVSEQGFSADGMACYGMGRLLPDERRAPIRMLQKGEHKQISNQRVRFVPLNDGTTQTVKGIFKWFIEGKHQNDIAALLNGHGIPSAMGGLWTGDKVLRVLTNETYTWKRIYNKTWNRLRQGKRRNPRSAWIVYENAFPASVTQECFDDVQKKISYQQERKKSALKHIRETLLSELRPFLLLQGIGKDISREFPLAIDGKDIHESSRPWCFLLPRSYHRFSRILCIGSSLQDTSRVAASFLIPIAEFGLAGVCLLREGSETFLKYKHPLERMTNDMGEIARELHSFHRI